MTTESEKTMVAEILRTLADEVEAYPDKPLPYKIKSTIYDLFTAMKIIDGWINDGERNH